MTVYIYTLADPTTGEIRYVGKTRQAPTRRLTGHRNDPESNHKTNWIKSLKSEGKTPAIEVVETIENSDDIDWQEAERFWITYIRFLGFHLTNSENGGSGGKRMSEETKRKLSIAHVGKKITDEHRSKIAAAMRGRVVTLQHRIRIHNALKGRKRPQEVCDKMSAARVGCKMGPMPQWHKDKVSMAQKGIKKGPLSKDHKAKISAFFKGRKQSAEQIKKRIEATMATKALKNQKL